MFSKIISSKTSKRFVSLLIVLSCLVSFSLLANAATTHSEAISFGSNHARGYSNAAYYVDVSNSSGFKTKLTWVAFGGMPSGVMPVDAKVYFRLYTDRTNNIKATNYNFHTSQHLAAGTWKSDVFLSGISHTTNNNFVMSSNTSSTLGATVNVDWKYY